MLGPALIVLLIGCVNVACMLFARGIERDVELGVRGALGATRGRIIRELIVRTSYWPPPVGRSDLRSPSAC